MFLTLSFGCHVKFDARASKNAALPVRKPLIVPQANASSFEKAKLRANKRLLFFIFTEIKSTVSPTAVMQLAPSALQGAVLHPSGGGNQGGGVGVKVEYERPLAQNHTTLHSMLASHGGHHMAAPQHAPPPPGGVMHPTALHPSTGEYATHNPDVLAGLAHAPGVSTHYSPMSTYAVSLGTAGGASIYTTNPAPLETSGVPQGALKALSSSHVDDAVVMGSLAKPPSDGVLPPMGSTVTLLNAINMNGGVTSGVTSGGVGGSPPPNMYSLAPPSPPKAVPVVMETSAEAFSDAAAPAADDKATPSTGSPHHPAADVITLAPAQITTGAQ